ncbi:MAG: aminomethyltransferase family protein [Planctomycetota bacterium]|jgi:aminomethyltransferase|nr:aminomethyltransferase family protein [Planctomycetota bacterium]
MNDGSALKTTPLHARHLALNATMAPFGGWDMPLWYGAGAIREHLAVVRAAGLFDTSHMDVIFVSGETARAFLDYAFTRDLADARPGRCAYGAFLDARGFCLDDAIVYPLEERRFAVVLNASMADPIRKHLASLPDAGAVDITEPRSRLAKFDVQGPGAAALTAGVLSNPSGLFAHFPYFTFKGDFDLSRSDVSLWDGTPVLLSRTGYTGEQGFEMFLPGDRAVAVWDRLMDAGADKGLLPCGLAARDSLRAGAVLPLSHQDIGAWPYVNHPWPFALPTGPDGAFTKKFHGADALDPATAPHTLAFVGFDPRRVEGHGSPVLLDGMEIGAVTTIVSDMAMGRVDGKAVSLSSPDKPEGWTPRGLCCGFVRVDRDLPPGTELTLKDARRTIRVEVAADVRPGRTARKKLPVIQEKQ